MNPNTYGFERQDAILDKKPQKTDDKRVFLPVGSGLEVNTGKLRTKGKAFLDFVLMYENPYQFVQEVGEAGTLCDRFLENAKRALALTPVLSGNFENLMLNQLLEIQMLNSLVPKGRTYRQKVESSPLYRDLKRVQDYIDRKYNDQTNVGFGTKKKTRKVST